MKNKSIGIIALGLLVTSCAGLKGHDYTTYNKISQELKTSVKSNNEINWANRNKKHHIYSDIMPRANLKSGMLSKGGEKTFNISANEVPAKSFFMSLARDSNTNLIIDPAVEGNITLIMQNTNLHSVLRRVERSYGYGYRYNQYDNTYEILPNNKVTTEVIHINYLHANRGGAGSTVSSNGEIISSSSDGASSGGFTPSAGGGDVSSGSKINTTYDAKFWDELQIDLQMAFPESPDTISKIVVNKMSGAVLITGYPKEIRKVKDYLRDIEHQLQKQVIIEAKILEITLSDEYNLGIQWEKIGGSFNGSILKNVSLPSNNTFGSSTFGNLIKFANRDFDAILNALSTQGNVSVLSSPRISSLNNQKAIIKVGSNEFFVTGVTSDTGGLGGGTSQGVKFTPFFQGISLDVIPQINDDKSVILYLKPSVSNIEEVTKNVTVNNQPNSIPLAKSTIRETDNVVSAENQQVIVIGGLMSSRTQETINRAPFLGRIPFLGVPFRNTDQQYTNTELVVLLKPTVIETGVWNKNIKEFDKEFNQNYRGFHIGENPSLFGIEGESLALKNMFVKRKS